MGHQNPDMNTFNIHIIPKSEYSVKFLSNMYTSRSDKSNTICMQLRIHNYLYSLVSNLISSQAACVCETESFISKIYGVQTPVLNCHIIRLNITSRQTKRDPLKGPNGGISRRNPTTPRGIFPSRTTPRMGARNPDLRNQAARTTRLLTGGTDRRPRPSRLTRPPHGVHRFPSPH